MKKLYSGNEAIARGAYESGVILASAYPGTPSTEILETIVQYSEITSEWAPNEKVALDVAVGGAYAGVRSMAVMKHVGLNVAADSFFYVAMTGAESGLVIVTADDPAMHSSQNEQDNRRYAKFARVPCLEPSDSQEAKDMVGAAFEISERFDTPFCCASPPASPIRTPRWSLASAPQKWMLVTRSNSALTAQNTSWFPATPANATLSLKNG